MVLDAERAGWEALMDAVVGFFRSGEPPVAAEQTVQSYAFMAAAAESKARGGAAVTLEEVLGPAREAGQAVLDEQWYRPATLKARGGKQLGAPPALAVVSDDRAAALTAEALLAHHDVITTVSAVRANGRIGKEDDWFGETAGGWGTSAKWREQKAAVAAESEVAEAEAER